MLPRASVATAVTIAGSNTIIAGRTLSTNFPLTGNALQSMFAGGTVYGDEFITVLNSTGTSKTFSTYLGGSGDDDVESIALKGKAIYLTGLTFSSDYPVTGNAFQGTCASGCAGGDLFISKITFP